MIRMVKSNFGLIFWLHLSLILVAYLSPILFNWRLILFVVFLYYMQQLIFNGCILTHSQFGKEQNMTFYYPYLKLIGFNPNKRNLKILMSWFMPMIILYLALFIQIGLEFSPLLF
jgi:hypothetical protein